jgi:hypothetical protein
MQSHLCLTTAFEAFIAVIEKLFGELLALIIAELVFQPTS